MSQPIGHPFRFAIVAAQASSPEEWTATARRAESAGYTTLLMPDVPSGPLLSPLPALAVAAARTTTLRVGTWVLANDLRNPVQVAREAATLDLLSDGRFELGLGAGRSDNDYASLGLRMESGGERVRRLSESVRIINALFRGEEVTVTGAHYSIRGATLFPPPRRRLPMLLAASGRRSMELAGQEADIVAMGGAASRDRLSEQVAWLKAAAGERFPEIELASLFHALPESDERVRQATEQMIKQMIGRVYGDATLEGLIQAGTPNLLTGSTEAMAERLEELRASFGLSYVVVASHAAEALAPVVARLSGR